MASTSADTDRSSESTSLTKSGICSECASVVPYTAHRAAIAGHLNCLKICVRRGCKLTSRSGDSLLHVASKYGQCECLEWILLNCPSLKILDGNGKGNNVLHCAMDGGDVDCVKMLFVRISGRAAPLVSDALVGAMSKANEAGMTPLLVAVMHGRTALVRWLLGVFAARVPGPMNNLVGGATVFHYAAALGSVEILTLLHQSLPSMAGLGVPKTGKLPIHLAVHTGHLEATQFLHKITKNGLLSKSVDGMNCFHQAVQNGHLQCLEWMVKQLLAEGQNIASCLSHVDDERASLFHFAAAFGETKCMQYLLQCLPDRSSAVAALDIWGRTPLHDAAEKNHLNCLKLLLVSGADIYARDKKGSTPYDLAMRHDKLRAYITEHMETRPPQKVARKPSPEGTQGGGAEQFARANNDGHRASVRYKQLAPRPNILPPADTSKSTTAPEHTYAAVVVSTGDSTPGSVGDESPEPDSSAFASPLDAVPSSGDIDSPEAVISDRSLSPDGVFCTDDSPTSPGAPPPSLLSPTGSGGCVGKERSASVGGGLDEAGFTPPAPENQPSVKIIHAGTADSRISHEVSKLSFAMGMFNVNVAIVKLKKDTLGAAKVRSPAELLEWLGGEKEGWDAVLLVCTSQLLEFFDCAVRGGVAGKKKKDKQPSAATPSFSLPAELKSSVFPIVTLHGASSRYRPPWLAPAQCYYWPKNQPSLFSKLCIQLPEQTLSLPTRRKRAGTM